jgi:hypothetical protein
MSRKNGTRLSTEADMTGCLILIAVSFLIIAGVIGTGIALLWINFG